MSLRVLRLAAGATLQDFGRPGFRRFGVPPGGAFDRESHRLALALVGRREGAALEIPMLGGIFEALEPEFLAAVGASGPISLNGGSMSSNAAFLVEPGDRLVVQPAERGVRLYLASARGWRFEPVLGSASGIEPGQVLEALPARGLTPSAARRLASSPASLLKEPFRFVRGPQARDADLRELAQRTFRVSLNSNRVGIRLEGGLFEPRDEIPSEPSTLGVIQLAPSGEILIHGPDGPTIGGYPKIGVVIEADLDRLAQLRPLDEMSFERASLEGARSLGEGRRSWLEQAAASILIASGAG